MRRGAAGALVALGLLLASNARADSFEPNDTPEEAAPLANGSEIESWISTETDLDWYGFEVYRAGTIHVRLRSLPADYDVVLFWRNPLTGDVETREGWRSDHAGTLDEEIALDPQRFGSFYVLVFGFGGAADPDDSYTLLVTWPPGGPPLPPEVAVAEPNGGEVWPAASDQTIRFHAFDPDTPFGALQITLEYSTNSGASWFPIISGWFTVGVYGWRVPDAGTTHARIRITASDGVNQDSDISDADFTITTQPPTVTVRSPNGGEHLRSGYSERVTYVATDPDTPAGFLQMIFEFSTDSGLQWHRIGIHTFPNTGEFSWLVYPYLTTMHARFRATALDGEHQSSDASDADFSITQTPEVHVSSPSGGERWYAGSSHSIVYEATDRDTEADSLRIDVEYSTDFGGTWIPIAADQPNTGRYLWTVPDTPTYLAFVRVGAFDGLHREWDQGGQFWIQPRPEYFNTLSVADVIAPAAAEIEVPLALENEQVVKEIRTILVLDPAVATFVRGSATGRAAAMSFDATVVEEDGGRVAVAIGPTGGASIPAGSGEVATLVFATAEEPGVRTDLALTETILEGPDDRPLHVEVENGSIDVARSVPLLRLAVLRNPGRVRTLQIFLSSDQPLVGVSVQAGTVNVEMEELDSDPVIYRGTVHLPPGAESVHVQAAGSNGTHVGVAETNMEF